MRIRATGSTMKRRGGGGGGCDDDCVTALIKMGRATVGMLKKKKKGYRKPGNGQLLCAGYRGCEITAGRWRLHQKAARPPRLA